MPKHRSLSCEQENAEDWMRHNTRLCDILTSIRRQKTARILSKKVSVRFFDFENVVLGFAYRIPHSKQKATPFYKEAAFYLGGPGGI